jgi:hypothetical protein
MDSRTREYHLVPNDLLDWQGRRRRRLWAMLIASWVLGALSGAAVMWLVRG